MEARKCIAVAVGDPGQAIYHGVAQIANRSVNAFGVQRQGRGKDTDGKFHTNRTTARRTIPSCTTAAGCIAALGDGSVDP